MGPQDLPSALHGRSRDLRVTIATCSCMPCFVALRLCGRLFLWVVRLCGRFFCRCCGYVAVFFVSRGCVAFFFASAERFISSQLERSNADCFRLQLSYAQALAIKGH